MDQIPMAVSLENVAAILAAVLGKNFKLNDIAHQKHNGAFCQLFCQL
jgi:hypothetical protein